MIRIWRSDTGDELMAIPCETDVVEDLRFNSDARQLHAIRRPGGFVAWDLSTGREVSARDLLDVPELSGQRAARSGTSIATVDWMGLEIRRRPNQRKAFRIDATDPKVLRFSHDRNRLATGERRGVIEIRDVETGRVERRLLHAHEADITALLFGPQDKALISTSRDETVRVWDLHSELGEFDATLLTFKSSSERPVWSEHLRGPAAACRPRAVTPGIGGLLDQ